MPVARKSTLPSQITADRAPVSTPGLADALFASLYHELHRLARREAARAGPGAVLSATTIIHEVYLDMSQRDSLAFPDRARFLSYAARAMRAVVIDRARADGAQKRGGGLDITSLDTETAQSVAEPGVLADIDDIRIAACQRQHLGADQAIVHNHVSLVERAQCARLQTNAARRARRNFDCPFAC